MHRREFLRIAGATAGSLPVFTFLNGFAFSAETGEAVFAASAISRPSFSAPAIVLPGAAIPMSKTPGEQAVIESAWLQAAGSDDKQPLSVDERGCCGHPFALYSSRPLEPGLFDLYVEASRGGKSRVERQPHAVKVVEQFKKDFRFGVISDVHFGDPRLASQRLDFSVADTVRKEIAILNERGVEFCLCCGDLSFLPPATKKEIMEYAEMFSEAAQFPLFTVPGNHDGYTTGAGGKINFDTQKHWEKFFGGLDFSASYGDMAIIGANTFDKSEEERNVYGGHGADADSGAVGEAQLKRISGYFEEAKARESKSVILMGHHNPTNTVKDKNGPIEFFAFSETGRLEFLKLIETHAPDYFFVGHVHGIHRETYASTEVVTAPTAASMPNNGHPVGFYIVTVKDWKIDSVETIEMLRV